MGDTFSLVAWDIAWRREITVCTRASGAGGRLSGADEARVRQWPRGLRAMGEERREEKGGVTGPTAARANGARSFDHRQRAGSGPF